MTKTQESILFVASAIILLSVSFVGMLYLIGGICWLAGIDIK